MFRIFFALALLLTSGIAWAQQGPKQAKPQEPTTSGLFEGTPEEQAAVRAAVARKYPGIGGGGPAKKPNLRIGSKTYG